MLYRILNAVALILPDTLSNSEYNNPYLTTWLPMPKGNRALRSPARALYVWAYNLLKCRRILQHSNRVFGAIVTLVVTQVGGKNSVIL